MLGSAQAVAGGTRLHGHYLKGFTGPFMWMGPFFHSATPSWWTVRFLSLLASINDWGTDLFCLLSHSREEFSSG